jgi:hypothetical protein
MTQAKRLEASHEAIRELLALEEISDVFRGCYEVCLWWHSERFLVSLVLRVVIHIVVPRFDRHRETVAGVGVPGDRKVVAVCRNTINKKFPQNATVIDM